MRRVRAKRREREMRRNRLRRVSFIHIHSIYFIGLPTHDPRRPTHHVFEMDSVSLKSSGE